MRRTSMILLVAVAVVLAGCAGGGSGGMGDGAMSSGGSTGGAGDGSSASIGVSAGGAQDANTFRRNVGEGYVPQPTDITYEGIYHDYYFDTGSSECDRRFCPTYSRAVSQDPLSGETEQFVAVGLTSGLTEESFSRENVNLIVVLDTSGSMADRFDRYYYDGDTRQEVTDSQRKIDAARDAVTAMTDRLGPNDRLGIVTYAGSARTLRPLSTVENTDTVRSQLSSAYASGGTNLDAGMRTARKMAESAPTDENRTTRVVYVTDAMPNLGDTSGGSLESRLSEQAATGTYSTFVGVGVDFNSRLTETIATVRGANYYSIDSPAQFRERMQTGFSFMTTPLAHNLTVSADTTGYEVEAVYGTPGQSPERLLHVPTLFPSRSSDGGGEGSVILLELDRTEAAVDPHVMLTASYETPDGELHATKSIVSFDGKEPNYYESSGVRKAVVLTEYASLVRNWAAYERADASGEPTPELEDGVEYRALGQWEQRSVRLQVSDPYRDRFRAFAPYFESHRDALGAERMTEDIRLVRRLASGGDAAEG